MAKEMQIAAGVNFDLLKTNLSAMYEKYDKGHKILLVPTKIDSPNSVTLEDMIKEFKVAFKMDNKDATAIEESLKSLKGTDEKEETNGAGLMAIKVQLQSAFLYMDIPEVGEGEREYAIAVKIDTTDALPDLGFVKLNSLSIAVWNTERTAVLQTMGMGQIDKLLGNLNAK